MELDTASENAPKTTAAAISAVRPAIKDNILSFPIQVLPSGAAEFKRHYERVAQKGHDQITVEMHDNADGSLATIGMLLNMRRNVDDQVTICLQNCQPKVKYLLSMMDGGEGFVFKEGLLG